MHWMLLILPGAAASGNLSTIGQPTRPTHRRSRDPATSTGFCLDAKNAAAASTAAARLSPLDSLRDSLRQAAGQAGGRQNERRNALSMEGMAVWYFLCEAGRQAGRASV
jgi:hypothetical protein